MEDGISIVEQQAMLEYLERNAQKGLLEPGTIKSVRVREFQFSGIEMKARNVVYGINLFSGGEVYAVDGFFFNHKNREQFRGIYKTTDELADKIHIYNVARIREEEGNLPQGAAQQIASVFGLEKEVIEAAIIVV